jgi:hypothetical protein
MIICALNQNMLALHFSKILATDDDNKGLNCFHPAFHGKHALVLQCYKAETRSGHCNFRQYFRGL